MVILDSTLGGLEGAEATRQIRMASPKAEVLILAMGCSEQRAREVMKARARGCLMKSDSGSDIVRAVKALADHRTFFTPGVADIVSKAGTVNSAQHGQQPAESRALTRREHEVLGLLAEGNTVWEVAKRLGISTHTVDIHRANIGCKLRLRSVGSLIRYAIRTGITKM